MTKKCFTFLFAARDGNDGPGYGGGGTGPAYAPEFRDVWDEE